MSKPVQESGGAREESQLVISPRQSCSIIASTLIGVAVLTLPRVVTKQVGEAGWFAVLLGAIVSALSLSLLTSLSYRFPKQTILEYTTTLFSPKRKGKFRWGYLVSIPFNLIFISYLLLTAALVKRTFGEVVVTAVLTETPLEVIILTMMATVFFMTIHEVDALARVNEILLPIIVFPILVIALFSYQNFTWEFILPVWPMLSLHDFFLGVLLSIYAYYGFEIYSVYSAYTITSKKTMHLNQLGILVPTLIYLLVVIACIGVFGKEELEILMWPTLELVKTTQIQGVILERMESAFLGVWVAAVFTTAANFHFAAIILISRLFQLEKYKRWINLAIMPIIYWFALLPQSIIELFEMQRIISFMGIPFVLVLPVTLFILAKLRKFEIQADELKRG